MSERLPPREQLQAMLKNLSPEERTEIDELGQMFKARVEAEVARRELMGADQPPEPELTEPDQAKPRTSRRRKISTPSATDAPQKPSPQLSSGPLDPTPKLPQSQSSMPKPAHLAQPQQSEEVAAREARLQMVRTQEIGQIAEAALVRLVDEGDAHAHAFQREQMAALRDELAPPGSPIAERLLAEAIVKARFEYLMWSTRSAQGLLNPPVMSGMLRSNDPPEVHAAKRRAIQSYKDRGVAMEQSHQAQKRYLSAMRDLEALRRQNAPLLQVNIAPPPIKDTAHSTEVPTSPRKRALRRSSASALGSAETGSSSARTWETSATPDTQKSDSQSA